jgi:hypothetical protein
MCTTVRTHPPYQKIMSMIRAEQSKGEIRRLEGKKAVGVSVLVLSAVILAMAIPSMTALESMKTQPSAPIYSDGCMPVASGFPGSSPPDTCSVSLSATSVSPGTKVTVNFMDTSIGYGSSSGYDPVQTMPYRSLSDNGIPEYSIHLQGQGVNLDVASLHFTCISMSCAPDGPLVSAAKSGTFSATFTVPNVSPGTYSVVVTLVYPTPVASYSSSAGSYSAESASATLIVT